MIDNPIIAIPGCMAFSIIRKKAPILYKIVIAMALFLICRKKLTARSEKAFLFSIKRNSFI